MDTAEHFVAIHRDMDEILGETLDDTFDGAIRKLLDHFGPDVYPDEVLATGYEVWPIAIVTPTFRGVDMNDG